jgi:threonine dehydrogenase-like Zn-dependent dehydrogenase
MLAWVLYGPRDLKLEEIYLDTDNMQPDEIWVRTDVSALSPGTDRGNYEGAEQIPGAPDYPRRLGYSNAGTVTKVGNAVTRFTPGDRVFSMKRHQSDYMCKESDMVIRIPDKVSSESASLTYLYHLGYHALRIGQLCPGENVAVVGTGLLGLTTITLARVFGARVVALTDMEGRMEVARKVGAHRAWLSNDPELQGKLLDFTDALGIDLVVLAANPWPAYQAALESVRAGGRVSILAFPGRDNDDLAFNPLASKWLYAKSLTIKGCCATPAAYPYPMPDGTQRFSIARGCQYILHLMEDETIRPADLITHRFRFDRANEVYEMLYHRDTLLIGAVFDWRSAH